MILYIIAGALVLSAVLWYLLEDEWPDYNGGGLW